MSDEGTLFHFDDGRKSFEDLGQPNGATHWDECDVRASLGYATVESFNKAIIRAKQACLTLGLACEEHFARQPDGTHILTRFGCYLVAMNGDPRKPEVAAAQVYFAAIAETFQSHLEATDGMERLLTREEIADGQKTLHSTAKSHGVENYAFFQDQGYLGMYNMRLSRICELKGAKPGELIDRMGKREMAAHLFRISETNAKIKNEGIRGQDRLEQAANHVGKQVRRFMQSSGTNPEDLPLAEHTREVRKKIKGANKNLKAIDKAKNSAKKLPPPEEPQQSS